MALPALMSLPLRLGTQNQLQHFSRGITCILWCCPRLPMGKSPLPLRPSLEARDPVLRLEGCRALFCSAARRAPGRRPPANPRRQSLQHLQTGTAPDALPIREGNAELPQLAQAGIASSKSSVLLGENQEQVADGRGRSLRVPLGSPFRLSHEELTLRQHKSSGTETQSPGDLPELESWKQATTAADSETTALNNSGIDTSHLEALQVPGGSPSEKILSADATPVAHHSGEHRRAEDYLTGVQFDGFLEQGQGGQGGEEDSRLPMGPKAPLDVPLHRIPADLLPYGKRSKVKSAEFIKSSSDVSQCPQDNRPEIAVIGRSNVGKSSLINMLTNRRDLAQTSKKPGKTQLINHFLINDQWYLVDLPGYGYAKAPTAVRDEWHGFTQKYFVARRNLATVLLLVDASIPPMQVDLDCADWLGQNKIPVTVIFTKCDRRKKRKNGGRPPAENVAEFESALGELYEEPPPWIMTSSVLGMGKETLLAHIAQVISHWKS